MQVQPEDDTPVLCEALTPKDFRDSTEHHAFFHRPFVRKREEAARACIATLRLAVT